MDDQPDARFPILVHFRAANGSTLVCRFAQLEAPGELVDAHVVGDAFPAPVDGVAVDRDGRRCRLTVLDERWSPAGGP